MEADVGAADFEHVVKCSGISGGLTIEETAEFRGVSPTTVKGRRVQARDCSRHDMSL